ncbi:FAD-dependent monooxygenase [Streptomyces sp. NPDC090106]|uniref:FAD-dependent monooxygenase n=1 Tax=Streptomyces sp. NPDC090106 TaxID=3365946 RepID=UPI003801CDD6
MIETKKNGRALVVGLGIAGIATALRLRQIGWEPVVVERAPARRSGGYFIMLFGTGSASAERLGVLDDIGDRSHDSLNQLEVNRQGRRRPGISPADTPDGPRTVLRGDVERGLFDALPDDVEIRYSTVPVAIAQDADGVDVTLHDSAADVEKTERFDLVVGADGMRSTVRRLAFGGEDFLHPLNYMIAATVLDRPVTGFGLNEGLVLAEAGRSAWTFPFYNHAPSLLFSYRTEDIDAEFRQTPIESLRTAFGPEPTGALLEELFEHYENAPDSLFDAVHQVKMPKWHEGRVALVGDAAWCLSLYSGMGASSSIAGGELLGTMVQKHAGNLPAALGAWEERMRPFISTNQASALVMRRIFTPQDAKERVLRSGLVRLMNTPGARKVMHKAVQRSGSEQAKHEDVAAP